MIVVEGVKTQVVNLYLCSASEIMECHSSIVTGSGGGVVIILVLYF